MCILLLHYHPPNSAGTSATSATGNEYERPNGVQCCSCPYVLIAANNRDEYFDRPTQPVHFWPDQPSILAGRDTMREERGTWMGVSKAGRFAVLTNFRCHASELRADAATRGTLVSDFLSRSSSPKEYCRSVMDKGHLYNGFSLLTAQLGTEGGSSVAYCSNRSDGDNVVTDVGPGTYGLSNATLDYPWKKVDRGREKLRKVIEEGGCHSSKEELTDHLMQALADDTCLHPDPNIPDTGFNYEALLYTSSVFVQPVNLYGKPYGTRTSSVVLIDHAGQVTYTERTLKEPMVPGQLNWITSCHQFQAW